MKKSLQFILVFVLAIGMFVIPGAIAKAEEKEEKTINNNTIRLWSKRDYGSGYWADFKFLDMGDGTVRLRPVSNGNIIDSSQLPDNTRLSHPYTIKFYDNEGSVYYSKDFPGNRSIKSVAQDLENIKMRHGLDSIQITYELAKNALVSISGTVYSNIDNYNFGNLYKEAASKYSFRVERDGLYAEYRNQVRIPDGEYIIETAENPNRVLDILDGYNTGVTDFNKSKTTQKFKMEYNNTNKAYKIRTVDNRFIGGSTNVIATAGPYLDQFWYLENAENGRHRLVNAHNTEKLLNLDANNTNISVAERRNNFKQEFKFIKPENKTEVEIIEGEWAIASKLNHEMVLDSEENTNNVLIWPNRYRDHQRWIFEYNPNKKAYVIRNKGRNTVLTWDSSKGNNVITHNYNSAYADQYWILENVGNGDYIFKNYYNQNLILDLYGSNTNNGSNIQVHERKNTDNQKFKLIR